jgi:hypothetical protein
VAANNTNRPSWVPSGLGALIALGLIVIGVICLFLHRPLSSEEIIEMGMLLALTRLC